MTRAELADAMWDNFKKLPPGAKDRISIMNFRDYIEAVADQLGLEKQEVDLSEMMEALKTQPYDAIYAHHTNEISND